MIRHTPHHTNPSRESARVILAYKNFAANKGISHIGLGVAAMNTSATLRRLGYWVEVWPITSAEDLATRLAATQTQAMRDRQHPISHVVISAPWIQTPALQALLMRYSDIHFAVVSHSNVGFLMADPDGIKLLREGMELAVGHHNFKLAGNCQRFVSAWSTMYGGNMIWLPNLYDTSTIKSVGQRLPYNGGILRVGVFGATRPLKNMVTATAAAIELSSRLRTDIEIWTSSGRNEGGGTVDKAIAQLVSNLPHVQMRPTGWRTWPAFRQVVSKMHVLLNPSYTESFNMVTADGIAEGVASVVSDAIDWVPNDWVANADSVDDIARVARRHLQDCHSVDDGQKALRAYVDHGSKVWSNYLG